MQYATNFEVLRWVLFWFLFFYWIRRNYKSNSMTNTMNGMKLLFINTFRNMNVHMIRYSFHLLHYCTLDLFPCFTSHFQKTVYWWRAWKKKDFFLKVFQLKKSQVESSTYITAATKIELSCFSIEEVNHLQGNFFRS